MNITRTSLAKAPQPRTPLASQNEPQPPADGASMADTFSMGAEGGASGVVMGSTGLGGAVVGGVYGLVAAYEMGVVNATPLLLTGMAVGAAALGTVGYLANGLVTDFAGSQADKLGLSEQSGRALGSTALAALTTGVVTGSATTGLLAAAGGATLGGGIMVGLSKFS